MRLLFFILLPSSILLVFLSCKRIDKKKPIRFTIQAHIPYSGEPISGVKYRIVEYRSKKFSMKLNDIEYTDFKMEGVTDAGGWARVCLIPKKNLDYHYVIDFDYSNIQFPSYSGDYTLINEPHFDMMTRNNQRSYEIRALPHCSIHYKIENVNCFDSNDKMRYKVFNSDEFPHQSFQYIYTWGNYFNGCGTFFDGTFDDRLSGHQIYQIEVTRNGQVTTYIDTFFLKPGIMNEVFIEY